MIKIGEDELSDFERRHPGIRRSISYFENAALPKCPRCDSGDTAQVQCGIIGRTIYITAATTKMHLIPNGPKPGEFFCNSCREFFDWGRAVRR